jgi:hypothetical protein
LQAFVVKAYEARQSASLQQMLENNVCKKVSYVGCSTDAENATV